MTLETIEKADIVFILNPNVFIRDYWIIKRFLLSRTGIRPWNYKQTIRNLCKMIIKWNHQYDVQRVLEIITEYRKNPFIVRRKSEVINRIEEHMRADLRRQ